MTAGSWTVGEMQTGEKLNAVLIFSQILSAFLFLFCVSQIVTFYMKHTSSFADFSFYDSQFELKTHLPLSVSHRMEIFEMNTL